MTQAIHPVTIEVNIAPSLMEHSSLYIKSIEDAIRDACGNPEAAFSRCNGFSGSRRSNVLTVYPVHDEVIVPDFTSNLRFSTVAYSETTTTNYRTLVNGYVSTLAEAMAFPRRSLMSHAGVVLGTIKQLVKPDMVITVLPPYDDVAGCYDVGCHVLQYDNDYADSRQGALRLYGTYLAQYNKCLGRAHLKVTDLGIIQNIVSCYGNEDGDIDVLKHYTTEMYLEYVKEVRTPTPSP